MNLRLIGTVIAMTTWIGSLGGALWIGHRIGSASVQFQWDAERVGQAKATLRLIEQKDAETARLQSVATRIRQEKHRELQAADARYRAELERLRDRPEVRADSPSGLPETPTAGAGCTGAGLAGPDARFLAGFALDAARLQAAYSECKAKYDALVRYYTEERN